MAIVFESDQDPMGFKSMGSMMGQMLYKRGEEKKAEKKRLQSGSTLASAMQEMQGKSPEEKLSILGQALQQGLDPDVANRFGMSIMAEAEDLQKQIKKRSLEQQEVQALLRLSGKAPEEIAVLGETLTPTSARELLKSSQSAYEPESQKLSAKRQSEFADTIIQDYKGAETSKLRLDRMTKLNESNKLTNQYAATVLDKLNLPISVLRNPDSEEFAKLEADFSRDASKYFPGQVRTAELVAFMKSIPSLMNSKEGRSRVIQNLKLVDEAKTEKFNAYKEILKENKGIPPNDLDIQVFERTKEKMEDIGRRFASGIADSSQSNDADLLEQIYTDMIDSAGEVYRVPNNRVGIMQQKGLKLK